MGQRKKWKNRKNDEAVIEERRQQVSILYRKGFSQAVIAKSLSVCQQTISLDLQALREKWLADSSMNFAERQAEEVMRCNEIERQANRSFELSCIGYEMRGKGEKARRVRVEKPGDARYLKRTLEAIELRCKILGVIRPAEMKVVNTNLQSPIDWNDLFLHCQPHEIDDPVRDMIDSVKNGTYPANTEQLVNRLPPMNGSNGTH